MTASLPTESPTGVALYRERLWPSPWVFLATALVIPAGLLVFLPINFGTGVVVALVLYAAIVLVLVATSPTVRVTPQSFAAGRANVPVGLIGDVTPYTGEEATLQRGRLLDARAWLLIRGWISPVVKVDIADANDPTPYWVVSTRAPGALVAAIAAAKASL